LLQIHSGDPDKFREQRGSRCQNGWPVASFDNIKKPKMLLLGI